MAKKNKYYTVCVEINLSTDVEIVAESFEDALIKAKEYKTTDIVTFNGNHNDSSIKVIGVFVNE